MVTLRTVCLALPGLVSAEDVPDGQVFAVDNQHATVTGGNRHSCQPQDASLEKAQCRE